MEYIDVSIYMHVGIIYINITSGLKGWQRCKIGFRNKVWCGCCYKDGPSKVCDVEYILIPLYLGLTIAGKCRQTQSISNITNAILKLIANWCLSITCINCLRTKLFWCQVASLKGFEDSYFLIIYKFRNPLPV